ncbi:MAG: GerAB/ArcD/ProY family transporter, partial [Lachnospiraceae bacterium]|nr:GerAB/ArcD/ProY family transporter [Lachnospiraceae bacterium]
MYADNGKISNRQIFRLYVFDLIGISTLLLPPYLAKLSGSDGIFAILIGCILGYVYLRYIGYVLLKMDTDIGTYLEQGSGKWIKYVSYGFVYIHSCLTAGFCAYVFCNLMQYSLVKEVNYFLLLIVTIIAGAYSVNGGIENRARVYEVLFWFILIPYGVMMLMSAKDFEVTYVNHFLESQPIDIIKSIYLVFLFLTPLFFSLFLINCKEQKTEHKVERFHGKKEKKSYGQNMVKVVSLALLVAAIILLVSYV